MLLVKTSQMLSHQAYAGTILRQGSTFSVYVLTHNFLLELVVVFPHSTLQVNPPSKSSLLILCLASLLGLKSDEVTVI